MSKVWPFFLLLVTVHCATSRPERSTVSTAAPAPPASNANVELELNPLSPAACFELAKRYQVGRDVPRDGFEAARQAYRAATAGHAGAQAWLQARAQANDASALLWLGRELEDASNVDGARARYAAAQRILEAGIYRRDADALTVRAFMLRFGLGAPKDLRAADDLLLRAAELGDARAQYLLGVASWFGRQLPTQTQPGVTWVLAAVAQGHIQARTALALYYLVQRPTQDGSADPEAVGLLRRSAEQGDATAQTALGNLLDAARVAPALQGQRTAREWQEKSAAQRNTDAQEWLCRSAAGEAQVTTDLFGRCSAAASNGSSFAAFTLANAYRDGRGVARDAKQALVWLTTAAKHGHTQAASALGLQYATGDGVARDPSAAFGWMRRVAQQRDVPAQLWLADAYERGEGPAHDEQLAAQWFRRAAVAGDAKAQRAMALRHEQGLGVTRDARLAAQWRKRADESDAKERRCAREPAAEGCAAAATPDAVPAALADRVMKFALLKTALLRPWRDGNGKPLAVGPWFEEQQFAQAPIARPPAAPAGRVAPVPEAQRKAALARGAELLLCAQAETFVADDSDGLLSIAGCGELATFDCRTDKACVPLPAAAAKLSVDDPQPGLPKTAIRAVIGTGIHRVRECYEREYASLPSTQPWPNLRVLVKFVITPSGAAGPRAIENSDKVPAGLGACMLRAFDYFAFPPPPEGGIVVVTYPFDLQTG